ncbi:COG3329 Predicted permease [Burkholderiaceae bacterium]
MHSLLDPAIMFFLLGILAGSVKSNLEIPPPIAKFLALYLLMAVGLKGGFALDKSGLDASVVVPLLACVAMAFVVPMMGYAVLRRITDPLNAAAVAAAYGSVSAVTFVTATQYLDAQGMAFGGHMAAAMVLMETPAILLALIWARRIAHQPATQAQAQATPHSSPALATPQGLGTQGWGHWLRECFTEGAQMLLLGALLIGFVSGETGQAIMQPFSGDLFKGMLAFFLLDMGVQVAKNFSHARQAPVLLWAYALVGPLMHAGIALALAAALDVPVPDAVLLMVLSASASYIVVPAVLRHAMPQANPAIYLGLSLGLTFPFNILLGIPLYVEWAHWALG